jgi:hypothetical protein
MLIRAYGHNGQVIGEIVNNVFCKKVKKHINLLYNRNAWCIDKIAIDEHLPDISWIQVYDFDDDVYYTISIERFLRMAEIINYGCYGVQYAVPRLLWSRNDGIKSKGLILETVQDL